MFERFLGCCCSSLGRKTQQSEAVAQGSQRASTEVSGTEEPVEVEVRPRTEAEEIELVQLIHAMMEQPIMYLVVERLGDRRPSPEFAEILGDEIKSIMKYNLTPSLVEVIQSGVSPANVSKAQEICLQLATQIVDNAEMRCPMALASSDESDSSEPSLKQTEEVHPESELLEHIGGYEVPVVNPEQHGETFEEAEEESSDVTEEVTLAEEPLQITRGSVDLEQGSDEAESIVEPEDEGHDENRAEESVAEEDVESCEKLPVTEDQTEIAHESEKQVLLEQSSTSTSPSEESTDSESVEVATVAEEAA